MNSNDSSTAQRSPTVPNPRPDAVPDSSAPSGTADAGPQKARRTAGRAVEQAKEKLSTAATHGKDATADRIGGYGERLRNTARSAEENEDPNIAHLANRAADRLQRAADYVRDADFARLRDDAADVARRHPGLFMGGMFLAGVVAGNLARASVQTLRDHGEDYSDGADRPDPDESEYSNGADGNAGNESASYSSETRGDPQI